MILEDHKHVWTYVTTYSDWWDGDEEEIYKCNCGERKTEYISR
jgi:hypothetical protein